MAREPLPTWYFALVVVRRGHPDDESLGAAWLTLEEIRARPLRGDELVPLLDSIVAGRQIFPLDLIGRELSV